MASDSERLSRQAPLRVRDYVQALCQYLYPTHALSALARRATRIRWAPVKRAQIRWFARRFGVDLSAAATSDPGAYPDFNTFFTRALHPGARPIAPEANAVASPADGEVSQLGNVRDERLLQAKGREYTLSRLLGDGDAARAFRDGAFFTVYLHPRDYHRVHMPLAGRLREMVHVPGRLFSVSRASTRLIPELFARNERVICRFESDVGPMAVVLVGAVCVGQIETVWAGAVTPRGGSEPTRWAYRGEEAVRLERGAELGRFNMGSTVILLLPHGAATWRPDIGPGRHVLMGQAIGRLRGR